MDRYTRLLPSPLAHCGRLYLSTVEDRDSSVCIGTSPSVTAAAIVITPSTLLTPSVFQSKFLCLNVTVLYEVGLIFILICLFYRVTSGTFEQSFYNYKLSDVAV